MILDRLIDILKKVMPTADTSGIGRETRLAEDLGINSLTMMLLAIMVEDEFGFHFEESVQFENVGDICDYMEQHAEVKAQV